MTRSRRLRPLHELAVEAEQAAGRSLADAERAVQEASQRLAQLEGYEAEYRVALRDRAATGIGAAGLRDYQAFLARLGEAVAHQQAALERARQERDTARERWLQLNSRRRVVGKVIERSVADDRRALDRREQRDSDERAQRSAGGTGSDDADCAAR